MIEIRKSEAGDREAVRHLVELCFGDREKETLKNLGGRYWLLFKDGVLAAMTGLMPVDKSEYRCPEVDWTCTHPDYRHQGLMQRLFARMLENVHEDVYCSCWRLPGKERVNLYSIMMLFGFHEVIRPRACWKTPHNCSHGSKENCVQYTGEGCECWDDLFLREAR